MKFLLSIPGAGEYDIIIMIVIYLFISVTIFLIIREILMWYWKINERISLLKESNKLKQENNQLLKDFLITINSPIYNTPENKLKEELGLLTIPELEEIVKNYKQNNKEKVLTSLDILKDRNKPYEGMRVTINEYFSK